MVSNFWRVYRASACRRAMFAKRFFSVRRSQWKIRTTAKSEFLNNRNKPLYRFALKFEIFMSSSRKYISEVDIFRLATKGQTIEIRLFLS